VIRLVVATVVTAALAAAVTTPVSRADGDPASDYLLVQNVFFPSPPPSPSVRAALERAVDSVYSHGDRLKVALISTVDDLGAIASLFGKPTEYARFLGIELGLWYGGPLLVVMPSGLGIYDGGRSTTPDEQTLQSVPLRVSTPDDLGRAAIDAVRQLAAAAALDSPDVTPPLVTAHPAAAIRGRPAALRFDVYDDSGRAAAVVGIYETGSLLGTVNSPSRFKIGTRTVRVRWVVPSTLRSRRLRFCVVASDPAGNRSAPACAPFLEVR